MAGYMGIGFMAAFAVSGSVVLIARQLHKRLLSDFMKQMEFELTGSRRSCQDKKRVRFADDVMEPSSNNKEYRRRRVKITKGNNQVSKMEDCVLDQSRYAGAKVSEIIQV
ncbi:hypothetical protein POTOM_025975 [Populus tomentosa]|uniref:Transmembrane protein n=1 Tax=Populus tomentosa TaxID=118781 RepID=A0A8X7ZM36_POPTO|nr:hypothetical protein POTOM_025975 [Populus tomentosa]